MNTKQQPKENDFSGEIELEMQRVHDLTTEGYERQDSIFPSEFKLYPAAIECISKLNPQSAPSKNKYVLTRIITTLITNNINRANQKEALNNQDLYKKLTKQIRNSLFDRFDFGSEMIPEWEIEKAIKITYTSVPSYHFSKIKFTKQAVKFIESYLKNINKIDSGLIINKRQIPQKVYRWVLIILFELFGIPSGHEKRLEELKKDGGKKFSQFFLVGYVGPAYRNVILNLINEHLTPSDKKGSSQPPDFKGNLEQYELFKKSLPVKLQNPPKTKPAPKKIYQQLLELNASFNSQEKETMFHAIQILYKRNI